MANSYGGIGNSNFSPQGELSIATRKWVEENNIPLHITFEITVDCNFKCQHCYNFDRALPKEKVFPQAQLSVLEISNIIDELYEEGALEITLTGGEALVHPGFFDIVRHIRQKNMAVYLKTNGMLLNPNMVKRLKEAGIFGLEISLYGAQANSHDHLTRVPGSFEKIIAGIGECKKQGLFCRINYVITNRNFAEVDAFMELCNELSVSFNLNPQITARYDGTDSSLDNRLNREELMELYSNSLHSYLPQPDKDPDASVQCSCARGMCGISAFGEVYPCIGAPIPSGNLRKKSFKEIWHNSPVLNKIRGLELKDFEDCRECPQKAYCRRSSGSIYANTGKYTGSEPWTCMEAGVLEEIYIKGNKS